MEKKEIDILIIEDSPTDTELLLEKVKEFKVFNCRGRVQSVKRIKEAEKILSEKDFDAILLDLNLPDSRGIESLKKIISIKKKAAVIIMTALSEQDIITETLNLGAQNYIIKGEESPVSLERAIMYSIERERNIAEITKNKKIQDEIIKNAPIMMFVLDRNGRALTVNPETEKFSNKTYEQSMGMASGRIFDCVNSYKNEKGCGHSPECETCPLAGAVKHVFATGESVTRKEIQYKILKHGKEIEKVFLVSAVKIPVNGGFGVLVSVEDITGVKNAEKETVFFADVQSDLAKAVSLQEIYVIIAKKMKELTGNTISIVSMTDDTEKEMKIVAFSGLSESAEKITQALGLNPIDKTYYISDMTEDDLKIFRSEKLELLKDGIYILATRKIPKVLCDAAAKLLNVKYVFSIGFVSEGRRFGGVSFLAKEDLKPRAAMIERVANYAAVIIRRKKAEESMRQSEEKYRQLYTSIGQGMALHEAILDSKGNLTDYRFLEVNERFEKMTGLKSRDIIGKTAGEILPHIEPVWLETYGKVVKTGIFGYTEEYSSDLKKYYAVYAYRPKPGQFATLVSDITDRKSIEEAIVAYNNSLSSALAVMQRNTESVKELLDMALEEIIKITKSKIGYIYHYYEDKKQFVLNTWSKDVMKECSIPKPPEVYELDRTGIWGEAVRQRKAIVINDFEAKNPLKKGYPGGHVRLYKFLTVPVISGGKIVAVAAVANKENDYNDTDITQLALVMNSVWKTVEQKKTEELLRESEQKFRAAFEQAAVGMTYTALDGRFIDVNSRFCKISGYTREELLSMKFRDIAGNDEEETDIRSIKDMLEGRMDVYKAEKRNLRKDGSFIWVNLTVSLVRNQDKTPKYFIAIYEDITARKKAENEERFFMEVQSFLSQAGSLEEQYRFISETIKDFIGGTAIVLVMAKDEQKQALKVASYSGMGDSLEKIIKILNVNPMKNMYKLSDIGEAELRKFAGVKLEMLEGRLYALSVGTIPKQACDGIQKLLKIDYVYTIGFVADGRHFGGVAILTSIDMKPYANIVERVMSYASNTIKRKIVEKELKSSEEKWVAFNEAEEDMLTMWDRDLNLAAANRAAREACMKLSGIKLDEGLAMKDLAIKLNLPTDFGMLSGIIGTGKTLNVREFSMPNGMGGTNIYSMTVIGMDSRVGLVVSDITELKRSEIILKESYEKLREADRLKSNFISIISHELRTPLTIIKGFTSFLIKDVAGTLNEAQRNFANTIEINTARLARLINDMVDMSKIESGSFSIEKENHDIVGIINEAALGMRHIAEKAGIFLETEVEVVHAPAEIDRGRILQTVTNLINNSMRFTDKDGTITLVLKHGRTDETPSWAAEKMSEEKNYYYLCVKDTGAGMEKKYLEKIFERFYQVENANTRKHQGAGLGLSIAKSIIDAHGGLIWAESEGPGKGSKVCMLVPE